MLMKDITSYTMMFLKQLVSYGFKLVSDTNDPDR